MGRAFGTSVFWKFPIIVTPKIQVRVRAPRNEPKNLNINDILRSSSNNPTKTKTQDFYHSL
ncbi:hypothetical protein RchiOBHm_Chr2g0146711 [Rosa chinensis]|uniref:Uncharacterized protein n=1 Tax=Rosa chinensis TaxID=74649 RepID=A0A2P6RYY9_ROSCH|nr:hypothetical protein RchiOBHm_Chr2g0146711 [Rosa chinensis]